MKMCFLILGFLIWWVFEAYVFHTFLLLKSVTELIGTVETVADWIQVILLAVQLAPLYTLGALAFSGGAIIFFSWLSEEAWYYAKRNVRRK